MKNGLVLLLAIGFAACALPAPSAGDQGLLLPGLKQPLKAGMSLRDAVIAFPDPATIKTEELANGATFCSADVGYPVTLMLVGDKLTDVWVGDVKAKSKFGKWFHKQVAALPKDAKTSLLRTESVGTGHHGAKWVTPEATWISQPSAEKGMMSYAILLPTDRTSLGNGMIVRTDALLLAFDQTVKDRPNDGFDIPPSVTSGPPPKYPEAGSAAGMLGRVLVGLYIDEQGKVQRWSFAEIKPLGYGFASEVEKVIPQWTFEPAKFRDKPVAAWVMLPFRFAFPNVESPHKFWPK